MSIIIVNYNTRDHLAACLASLRKDESDEVIVVDNASDDGSAEFVRAAYPWIKVVANATNSGYGAAANQGIALCSAPYVLLLNSDTLLEPGVVPALGAYMDENPRAALVGPRLLNLDGTLQPSTFSFPTPWRVFLQETSLERGARFIPLVKDRYLRTWPHDQPKRVPWVLGAALAIRTESFADIGGFDPSFFMYYEEVDLCYRLNTAGWEVHFTPAASVTHAGGASTRQHRAAMRLQWLASIRSFYQLHYSASSLKQLDLVFRGVAFGRILRDEGQRRMTSSRARRAMLDEDIAVWRSMLRNPALGTPTLGESARFELKG